MLFVLNRYRGLPLAVRISNFVQY